MNQNVANIDKPNFGVLYFHDENPRYRKMAELSIESLKRFHPEWPITVVETKSIPIQWWRKIYRAISPWKNSARYDRANQDSRIIAQKAEILLKSPYDITLFLDVDTIVTKPLDHYVTMSRHCDLLLCPLPWLKYEQFDADQPASWPAVMSGIMFYNQKFASVFSKLVDKYRSIIPSLNTVDQNIVSLACDAHKHELVVCYEPKLQIDVIDAHHHLGDNDIPLHNGLLDLNSSVLKEFAVFHYNEQKPQYMEYVKIHFQLNS